MSARIRFRAVLSVLSIAILLASAPPTVHAALTKRYTALGDSLAFGLWALRGYVPRYRSYIQQDTGAFVLPVNLGQPGWTSAQLRHAVLYDSVFRYAISRSQVITMNIGGNDLRALRQAFKNGVCGPNQECLAAGVSQLQQNWDAIIAGILALRGSKPTLFRALDIYNPYVNEDKAVDTVTTDAYANDFELLKPYLDIVNNHIAASCAATSFECAEVYKAFNGVNGDEDPADPPRDYISFDGYHPKDRGHKAMADALRAVGYN